MHTPAVLLVYMLILFTCERRYENNFQVDKKYELKKFNCALLLGFTIVLKINKRLLMSFLVKNIVHIVYKLGITIRIFS